VNHFDLNDPPAGSQWSVSVEAGETKAEQGVRLDIRVLLATLAAGAVIAVFVYCFRSLLDPTSSVDEKRWCMAYLVGTTSALIGYLIHK
jgi:hypothetical protein